MSPKGRLAMLTLWASSSQSGERCTKRSTTPATTTAAMAAGTSQEGVVGERRTAAYAGAASSRTPSAARVRMKRR
jgi:hypothetical protein